MSAMPPIEISAAAHAASMGGDGAEVNDDNTYNMDESHSQLTRLLFMVEISHSIIHIKQVSEKRSKRKQRHSHGEEDVAAIAENRRKCALDKRCSGNFFRGDNA